jgi:hypothetical protein
MTCKSDRAGLGAPALLAALLTPFATLAHLASEAASLGAKSPQVLFSTGHAYLAVLNAVAILVLACALGALERPAERRRRIALFVTALPGRGRGSRFLAAAALSQLIFFALTQLVEGDPMAKGHVIFGLVAATVVSIIGALIVAACKVRILRVLGNLLSHISRDVEPRRAPVALPPVAALAQRLFLCLNVANRPPPLSAA